jgi:hypothetical protein
MKALFMVLFLSLFTGVAYSASDEDVTVGERSHLMSEGVNCSGELGKTSTIESEEVRSSGSEAIKS